MLYLYFVKRCGTIINTMYSWVIVIHESVRGTIKSSWRIEGDLLYVDEEIPVNTTAAVHLPSREKMSVGEGG